LAQTCQVPPDSLHCWRGIGLLGSLTYAKERSAEFARYQAECHREYGGRHLQQVLQQRREKAERQRIASAEGGPSTPPPTPASTLPLTPMFRRSALRSPRAGTWSSAAEEAATPSPGRARARTADGLEGIAEAQSMEAKDGSDDGPVRLSSSPAGWASPADRKRAASPQKFVDPDSQAGSPRSSTKSPVRVRSKSEVVQPDERRRKTMSGHIGKRLNLVRLRLQSRLAQFESLSPLERERGSHAFSVGVAEQGMTERNSRLTERGMFAALASLGARGAGAAERDAVRTVVEAALAKDGVLGGVTMGDFVLNVVPSAREAIAEQRSRQLLRRFEEHDRRHMSMLTQRECLEALQIVAEDLAGGPEALAEEHFWETFVRDYPSILQRTQGRFNTTDVDFPGFKSVASQLEMSRGEFAFLTEKRVCKIAGLDGTTEARHFGEIARLHRAFTEHAERPESDDSEENEPLLLLSRSLAALLGCGVVPGVGRQVESARVALREKAMERQPGGAPSQEEASATNKLSNSTAVEDEGFVNFHDFLAIISELRKAEAAASKPALLQATKDTGLARDRLVPVEAWARVLVRGGFCDECCTTVAEVEAAVEECNREGLDALSFKEVHRLLSRVLGLTRSNARRREEAVAQQMGLDHHQVLELRVWWGRLTTDGVGTILSVRKALEELDPGQNFSDDEIEQIMLELQPPPHTEPLPVRKQQRRVSLVGGRASSPQRGPSGGSPRLLVVKQESRSSSCLDADKLFAAIGEAQSDAAAQDGEGAHSDSDGGSSLPSEPPDMECSRSWALGGALKASRRGSLASSRCPSLGSPSSRRASTVGNLKIAGSAASLKHPTGCRASAPPPTTLRFEGFLLLVGGYAHAD